MPSLAFPSLTLQRAKPFDPQEPGTSELEWRSMFRRCSEWRPHSGPLTVVSPHPDDEILGAGGLARFWAMTGQPVTIVSVTDGEAADSRRPDLNMVRRRELRNALRTLSPLYIHIERLGIPDGKVAMHEARLHCVLSDVIAAEGTIIAPFETDGHPDHEAVGRACLQVAASLGVPIVRYPVWAWHHATPATLKQFQWGLFPLDSGAQRAKRRAIQCFDSQLGSSFGRAIVPPHVLAYFNRPYEAFIL